MIKTEELQVTKTRTEPEESPFDPCPFCGNTVELDARKRIYEIQVSEGCKKDFVVSCPSCGCVGPWAITRSLSIENWNRREKPSNEVIGAQEKYRGQNRARTHIKHIPKLPPVNASYMQRTW